MSIARKPAAHAFVAPKPFKKALAAYNCGDLAKTEVHCRATLKLHPDFFDALHLLAIAQSRSGHPIAALANFDKALKLHPRHAEVINNRASALTEAKRYEEALAGYDQALEIHPSYADAHNNRGCVLMEMKRYDDALVSYSKALTLDPDNAEFTNNLGRSLTRLRRYADALDCYDDALALRPDYAEALINRGVTLAEFKRFNDAIACFDKVLADIPNHLDALVNRGNALNGLGSFEDALAAYDAVLALSRERPELYLNRGLALAKLKRFAEAFASCDKALALKVDATDVLIHRATVLMEMGRTDEAIVATDQAIERRPEHAEAYGVRGNFLMQLERLPEAITNFRNAVNLRADHTEAAWNLSYLLLLYGDFVEGWRHYEVRRIRTTWSKLNGPEWRGERLEGKRLMLYAEQGLGDALQFVRFVRIAARMGARVILGVYSPLAELCRMMDEEPIIVRHGEMAPAFDYQAPLMSVPFILGIDERTIPADVPYLRADVARMALWKQRLPVSGFRVGIAWQGATTDKERWVPLAAFAPLSRVCGVTLISLQKTGGLDQLGDLPAGMKVETLGPDFDAGPDAFLDTAAVMMNLDLVVSIDTSIAHLAGALGRPVWIALKHRPDWRWLLDRNDSPWYPTARLFRQGKAGDWTSVMQDIAAELASLVSSSTQHRNVAPA